MLVLPANVFGLLDFFPCFTGDDGPLPAGDESLTVVPPPPASSLSTTAKGGFVSLDSLP